MALPPRYRARSTSHPGIDHQDLDQFGYDWSQIGETRPVPRYPFKIYLPRTTEDVMAAVKEARALGQKLVIRGSAHSSNDLVMNEGGAVLSTAKLDQVLAIDDKALTVTLQAGAITAALDEHLATMGLGLPVLGDHNDITAGGFASAGGIGPASHRVGLFVDNVLALEWVDFEGGRHACDRQHGLAEMHRLLAGTGQFGVIVTFTLRLIRIDKHRQVLRNERRRFRRLDGFLRVSAERMADPGVFMQRGFWVDFPLGKASLRFGRFYAYRETARSPLNVALDRLAYGYLHFLGRAAGHLPRAVEGLFKLLGFIGMSNSPKYGTVKNVESFTDRLMASTVGDPTRWFIALPSIESYPALFQKLYELALEFRAQHGCFRFVSLYVKGIQSPYLGQGGARERFVELTLFVAIGKAGFSSEQLEAFVSRFDDLCLAHGAFRYMHTRTVKDAARRRRLDPNAFYAASEEDAAGAAAARPA